MPCFRCKGKTVVAYPVLSCTLLPSEDVRAPFRYLAARDYAIAAAEEGRIEDGATVEVTVGDDVYRVTVRQRWVGEVKRG